jgi:putative solute:sodium symporter small subunit
MNGNGRGDRWLAGHPPDAARPVRLRPKSGRSRECLLIDSGYRSSSSEGRAVSREKTSSYWKQNLSIVGSLLAIWFVVSYLAGIIFVDWLNQFHIFGFKLGFFFAQQGSMYIFVLLIFAYVVIMNSVDRKHDVHED